MSQLNKILILFCLSFLFSKTLIPDNGSSVIIEKDNSPNWKFKTIGEVPRDWVQEHLEPAWKYNPLEDI